MPDKKMPAAEAEIVDEQNIAHYELAFHVLPTVAEGEVTNVFQALKDAVVKHGGTINNEEAPARFDLAYEIIKYLEGRNRKFTSAYFGWIRFAAQPAEIEAITEIIEGQKELLRHLLIRLTRSEEEHPFFFHEALEALEGEKDVEDKEKPKDTKPTVVMKAPVEVEKEVSKEAVEDGEESKDKV